MKELAARILSFYINGFRNMSLGRTLWAIILIKLLIIFGVLKIFFFPDYLQNTFPCDAERAEHVITQLTEVPFEK